MLKRVFDILVSTSLLLILAPLIFIVALLIRVKLGRPLLFRQIRPGLSARPFRMVKFRTMIDVFDADGILLPDSDRLQSFGRWLRSTSIDELPSLWNVLKGDMSLVGPRPLLMEYLALYSAEQARRHEVRPGITGWAQVNGRNALGWDEKFALDVYYVDHQSLLFDLHIVWLTVAKVLKREGISGEGEETMSKFPGNRS